MSILKNCIPLFMIIFLFASCQKEELPIAAHDPGNVKTATVNMEANYKWQVFYNLKTNSVVSTNLKTAWDLGFETGTEGYHLILNASKVMLAYNKGAKSFEEVTDTNGFYQNQQWDSPSGSLDSTAIGDWRATTQTYIIDRGYSETGAHQGFRKLQIRSVDAAKYVIRYANLNGTGEQSIVITKDNAYNFMFLSLTSNQLVKVEPPKDKWDLVFTQYTHIFYNPTMTYLVTGCLLNRYQTQATLDKSSEFSAISYSNALAYKLTAGINSIGYDWKTYTGSTYTVNSKFNYIIRTGEGVYYKLHFIDFFNASGAKGNPKWEYQQL